MTSRTSLAAVLALLTVCTGTAASCGGGATSSSGPPPPPTLTSGTGTTTGSAGMTTAAAGTGGAGGSGEGGTGGVGEGGAGGTATCTDNLADGQETDKDCGGPKCDPCADTLACKVSADCKSKNCDAASHKCVAQSCMDGLKNGAETDVDCGGVTCPGCGFSQACLKGTDCKGGACTGLACAATCTDGTKSPELNETDVDCGGDTCPRCDTGKVCKTSSDCLNKICNPQTLLCDPPKCTDTIQNGLETDIDCGGGNCAQCEAAQKCTKDNDCRSHSCIGLKCACPAGMQPVPKKLGGGSYCIDTTEVTYEQYKVFYSANPSNLTLPAGCLGSGSYAPSNNWPAGPAQAQQQLPVSDVDWCDAVAYCLYSGKHLCGKVDGGANDQLDASDATKSEWYNACSAQGASTFPYGTTYDNTKCDGVDRTIPATPPGTCAAMSCGAKVGYDLTNPMSLVCQGGAPSIWGMSGNLAEWEDSCDGASTPNCLVRGGSRCEKGASLACSAGIARPRDYKGCDVGIRCCF